METCCALFQLRTEFPELRSAQMFIFHFLCHFSCAHTLQSDRKLNLHYLYQTSLQGSWQSSFEFGRPRVQISAQRPAIVNDFPKSFQSKAGVVP
jgi:hypothetical protein